MFVTYLITNKLFGKTHEKRSRLSTIQDISQELALRNNDPLKRSRSNHTPDLIRHKPAL